MKEGNKSETVKKDNLDIYPWVDSLKGIAIISIVLVHCHSYELNRYVSSFIYGGLLSIILI